MPTIQELRRERNRLMAQRKKKDQKTQLKREIRSLKYGGALAGFKSVGKSIGGGAVATGKGLVKYAEYYNRNETMPRKKKKKSGNYGFDYGGSVF